ncbi:MAG: motility protein A [Clostridiales bacterium]|nr:motility protein A [Clostridiales bacterium]
MELTSIIGLAVGLVCIVVSILIGGPLSAFINIGAIFIVVGGTIAATIVSFDAKTLKSIPVIMKNITRKSTIDLKKDIDMIINIANIARREGLLALDDAVQDIDNNFLKKGIMLIVDGVDTELLKDILETEIHFLQQRHEVGQGVMKAMATYAPAFGLIGTLIGLINMLLNLNDPDALGPAMSVALVTTFYGALLANLIFSPIAKKLETNTASESMEMELLLEGLLSIQDGENTRIIKDKLTAFVSKKELDVDVEEDEEETEAE